MSGLNLSHSYSGTASYGRTSQRFVLVHVVCQFLTDARLLYAVLYTVLEVHAIYTCSQPFVYHSQL